MSLPPFPVQKKKKKKIQRKREYWTGNGDERLDAGMLGKCCNAVISGHMKEQASFYQVLHLISMPQEKFLRLPLVLNHHNKNNKWRRTTNIANKIRTTWVLCHSHVFGEDGEDRNTKTGKESRITKSPGRPNSKLASDKPYSE